VIAGFIAIAVGLAGPLWLDSLVIASLLGILVFVLARVISLQDTQDVFTRGVYMMGGIGIIMIAAAGFASVMKATGSVESLVQLVSGGIGDQRGLAVFLMLLIGLIITMGIGSSFSTVPLIAAIYTPLCIKLGISPLATVAIVGVAGALGDAGSPVSESVLGPTAGLNADGQHDHIYDSTIPTFIHFNIPLLIAGWIAGMVL
ncbi:MAG: TRAP transporter large permease subunit, partial [Lentisphaeria bacterium]|nr:TRAP transporter large permease subunit [Lentisphaeria bacterium]